MRHAAHDSLLDRWRALGDALERTGPPGGAGEACWQREGRHLLRAWAAWPRRYHDVGHLAACLGHLDALPTPPNDPQAVALALWYHDAVYSPWSQKNEARSAEWARRYLRSQGLAEPLLAAVERHILATRDHPATDDPDTARVLDIDLAVLGAAPAVYQAFEQGVRQEYRWVPWPRYAAARTAVLQSFLRRPRIYLHADFGAEREAPARQNLERAIDALAHGRMFAATTAASP